MWWFFLSCLYLDMNDRIGVSVQSHHTDHKSNPVNESASKLWRRWSFVTIVKILFFIRIAMIGCLTVQSANLGIRNVD